MSIPSASLYENTRFNALVVVPNALQGIFRRRRAPVAAATRADVDRWAVGLLQGLRRSYDGGPVWVRVIRDPALLILTRPDVKRVLEGAPDPFAADPPAKKKGMTHFQPDALTISRGDAWQNRRRFTEAVLDTGKPEHRLGDRIRAVCAEEVVALLDDLEADAGRLGWGAWQDAFQRLVRRIVLGDEAREDEAVTELLGELMSEANSLPDDDSDELEPFMARLEDYLTDPEPGTLAALCAEAPHDDETSVAGQLPHWLFAMHDTLAINAFRALALIASHPEPRERVLAEIEAGEGREYLKACLEEAMRLWPTTPMLSRETTGDVEWRGEEVPAGTQVLIVNTFMHRDADRVPHAHRFAPEEWTEGRASEDWVFNHFSHGPQGCPGAGLALFVGAEVIAGVLRERTVELTSPELDPRKTLPHMLDFFGVKFELSAAH